LAERLPPVRADDRPKHGWIRRFVTRYISGSFAALPMAVQIVAILTLGYALWAYLRFDESQATAVAVGTILSFVVTGGHVQAIGRLGLSYSSHGNDLLAERVCRRLVRHGMVSAAVVALGWVVLNVVTRSFEWWVLGVALVYYGLLAVLWLSTAILYTVERRLPIMLTVVIGIVVIWLLRSAVPVSIYVAHWVGLLASNVLAWVWGRRVLRARADLVEGDLRLAELPRTSVLIYSVGPYFLYGTLYFSLLFADRVVAWSTADFHLPIVIWFRTPYELGLDWALLTLVLTLALLEHVVHEFADASLPTQRATSGLEPELHNRRFLRFYVRQVVFLGMIAVLSCIGVYALVTWTRRFSENEQARDFFASAVTFQVFVLGAIGYAFLALALMNASFFFVLSRPWPMIRAIGTGLALGVVVGYVLSRTVTYWWGGFGVPIGMGAFAVLSTIQTVRLMRNLDYAYYSAY
ncbi:MAG TPA: hypothetical protein VFU93_10335, partial [Acidimicrobiales bacterium]|nr:hypothetical protein [Acidimicrobiales bacterium]